MKQELGARLRGMGEEIPSFEWKFHDVAESERDACLQYELFRERAFCRVEALREEASTLENEAAERGDNIFRELLELQHELDHLRPNLRPWLSLSAKDKAPSFRKKPDSDLERLIEEPVWDTANLTSFQKWRVKSGGKRMSLEINVDWSRKNEAILKSFAKLIKSLRDGGLAGEKLPPCTETRGDKTAVEENLFYIAIWRMRKAGIRPNHAIITKVEPLRHKFSVASQGTLEKRFADYVRKAERLF